MSSYNIPTEFVDPRDIFERINQLNHEARRYLTIDPEHAECCFAEKRRLLEYGIGCKSMRFADVSIKVRGESGDEWHIPLRKFSDSLLDQLDLAILQIRRGRQ